MFNLANLFTAANLISGIMAILFAVMGRLDLAPFAILLGALFDFLDGFTARLLKTTGEIGKQLDSLADMVTFGVAPGVIMMVILANQYSESFWLDNNINFSENFSFWFEQIVNNSGESNYIPFAALLIPFFSMFRLAKFNLDSRQTDSFIGLPTPANTLFFMTFPLILSLDLPVKTDQIWIYQLIFNPWIIISAILIMGLLMVSEIRLFSLKIKSFKIKGNEIRMVFLLISLGLIILLKSSSLSLIVFLYLILSIVENKFLKRIENEI